MSFKGTTKIGGPVSPTSPADLYASHMALYGKGGFRSVDTVEERDAIPDLRREKGMKVYINDTDEEYRLVGGIGNSNWKLVEFSTTDPDTDPDTQSGNVILETMDELINYPTEDRTIGLAIYVVDADLEYRLVGGIDNSNWEIAGGERIFNNVYKNSIGCLNKSLMNYTIASTSLPNFGKYMGIYGEIAPSGETNEFSFSTENSIYWFGDYIYFTGSTEIITGKTNKVYMSITDDDASTTWCITDELIGSTTTRIKVNGSNDNWSGYLYFDKIGQKDIRVWEEQDQELVYNINKSVYIYAQNFSIQDGDSLTPKDIIETDAIQLSKKEYSVYVPDGAKYNIGLARINASGLGINTTSYSTIPGTTYYFEEDGVYTLNIENLRDGFINSKYALVLTGTENESRLPTYFYGPFTINLN